MIENVIGTYSLPIGVATNFIIDNEHYLIPFVLEEPSVVDDGTDAYRFRHVFPDSGATGLASALQAMKSRLHRLQRGREPGRSGVREHVAKPVGVGPVVHDARLLENKWDQVVLIVDDEVRRNPDR